MNKLLTIVAICTLIISCKQKGKPILSYQNTINLKDSIKANKDTQIVIYLTNSGDDTLLIKKYTCTCECTNIGIDKNTKIFPKDSLKVIATIHGYENDRNVYKKVECTFKTNTDSVFHHLRINYFVN